MKTRDGADFHLGMTLIWPSGAEVPTNHANFRVVEVNGRSRLERVESMASCDLGMFYSSETARRRDILSGIGAAIAHMESLRDAIKADPEILPCFHCGAVPDGGSEVPGECPCCGKGPGDPVSFELI